MKAPENTRQDLHSELERFTAKQFADYQDKVRALYARLGLGFIGNSAQQAAKDRAFQDEMRRG